MSKFSHDDDDAKAKTAELKSMRTIILDLVKIVENLPKR